MYTIINLYDPTLWSFAKHDIRSCHSFVTSNPFRARSIEAANLWNFESEAGLPSASFSDMVEVDDSIL